MVKVRSYHQPHEDRNNPYLDDRHCCITLLANRCYWNWRGCLCKWSYWYLPQHAEWNIRQLRTTRFFAPRQDSRFPRD